MTEATIDDGYTDIEEVVEVPGGWLKLTVVEDVTACVEVRQRRHEKGLPTVLVELDDDGNARVHIRGRFPGGIFVTDIPADGGETAPITETPADIQGVLLEDKP